MYAPSLCIIKMSISVTKKSYYADLIKLQMARGCTDRQSYSSRWLCCLTILSTRYIWGVFWNWLFFGGSFVCRCHNDARCGDILKKFHHHHHRNHTVANLENKTIRIVSAVSSCSLCWSYLYLLSCMASYSYLCLLSIRRCWEACVRFW